MFKLKFITKFRYLDNVQCTLYIQCTIYTKHHQQIQQEYHISLLKEPDSINLGHITVLQSDSEGVAVSRWNFLCMNQVNVLSFLSICSDGEATNTGNKNGDWPDCNVISVIPLSG